MLVVKKTFEHVILDVHLLLHAQNNIMELITPALIHIMSALIEFIDYEYRVTSFH